MLDINLAIVSGQRIIKAEGLQESGTKPVTVQAEKGARYVLAQGESLTGPEMFGVKRVGNNLQLTLQGGNPQQPNLIIEDFYLHPGEIIGLGEDGQWHAFTAASADAAMNPAALQDGEQSTVLLDSSVLPAMQNLEVANDSLAYGLLALGAAASIAALAAMLRSDGNHKSTPPPPPEETPEEGTAVPESSSDDAVAKDTTSEDSTADEATTETTVPSIATILDDLGVQQGEVMANAVTDDTTPTLSGTQELPGSIIAIQDNGMLIGTALVGADGNWAFTPASSLANGNHAFVVTVTDPDGVVSAPSDPATLRIEAANDEPPLGLEDLLPASSDLSNWAMFSSHEGERADYHAPTSDDDVNRLLDDLLGSHAFN